MYGRSLSKPHTLARDHVELFLDGERVDRACTAPLGTAHLSHYLLAMCRYVPRNTCSHA